MSATLQLTRPSRIADAARRYRIVLDGEPVDEVGNDASAAVPIAPGRHTLQVRALRADGRRPGLSSHPVSFDVADGATAEFMCRPPSYPRASYRWIICLLRGPSRWIALEEVAVDDGQTRRAGLRSLPVAAARRRADATSAGCQHSHRGLPSAQGIRRDRRGR
jgi:hypothetical protein